MKILDISYTSLPSHPKKRSDNQLFNFFIGTELTNFYSLMDQASQETYDRSKLEQFGATTGTNMLLKPDQRFQLI